MSGQKNCHNVHKISSKNIIMYFLLNKNELGCNNTVKHKIEIDDSEPFKERFRCIPPPLLDKVRLHINKMLEAGAIRPSNSPW